MISCFQTLLFFNCKLRHYMEVHCYDRGALLAEVWAGYTGVLASILREERAAGPYARCLSPASFQLHSIVFES